MTLTAAQETKLVDDVAEILVALKGNGLGSSEGMIQRVEDLETSDTKLTGEVRKLWRRWDRLKWLAFGFGVGAGALGGWVSTLIPGGTP